MPSGRARTSPDAHRRDQRRGFRAAGATCRSCRIKREMPRLGFYWLALWLCATSSGDRLPVRGVKEQCLHRRATVQRPSLSPRALRGEGPTGRPAIGALIRNSRLPAVLCSNARADDGLAPRLISVSSLGTFVRINLSVPV
jgi:hypothetical protein